MQVEVNLFAVLLAAISSMAVGFIWYSKSFFGTKWQKLVKLDEDKMNQGAGKAIGITFVISLITAYTLAYLAFIANRFFGDSFLHDSLATALWIWLGLVAARMVTHDLFEQRPLQLTVMNVLHELVTLMAMALVIGLMAP